MIAANEALPSTLQTREVTMGKFTPVESEELREKPRYLGSSYFFHSSTHPLSCSCRSVVMDRLCPPCCHFPCSNPIYGFSSSVRRFHGVLLSEQQAPPLELADASHLPRIFGEDSHDTRVVGRAIIRAEGLRSSVGFQGVWALSHCLVIQRMKTSLDQDTATQPISELDAF
jgi:hypothetical protein